MGKKTLSALAVVAVAAIGAATYFAGWLDGPSLPRRAQASNAASPDALRAHSRLFEKEILNPAPGIHLAVGYGLANSIMIEGTDGVLIIDTMESASRAKEVLAAFRKITTKPVAGIILTHNHTDHIFGGGVFAEGRDVPVYAHATTNAHIDKIVNVLRDVIYYRAMRMFGQLLAAADVINAGIGPNLEVDTADIDLRRPTVTFDETMEATVAGIRFKLVHAPGETPDQLLVWLPDHKAVLAGDNIYESFPNLYTIRGTAYRDVMAWVGSLDKMRDLEPEILVPSHTRPIVGAAKVAKTLTAYRDAIQYVHDQTIRGINKGMTADALAETIHLPKHLADHPWLQEFYGKVDWSVRAIFDGHLGWFSGDAVDLEPLPRREKAERLAAAFKVGKPVAEQAQSAAKTAATLADWQWVAELANTWMRLEPDSADARALLATAFDKKAALHANPNARHYYQTQALELRGEVHLTPLDPSRPPDDFIENLPIDRFMAAMPTRLVAENTLDENTIAVFHFTDVDKTYSVHIRHGVAEVRARAAKNPDLTFTTTTTTWKRIVSQKRNIAAAYAAGEISVDGGIGAALRFLSWFRE